MKALPRLFGVPCAFFVLALFTLPALAATDVVYIADIGGVIYEFNIGTGTSTPLLASSLLSGAVGLAQETNGDLLVSTVGSNAIRRIDHQTSALTVLSQGGLLQNPDLMGIIGSEVFVGDVVAQSIFGVNMTTGAQRTVAHGGLSNGGPWICAGTDGFIYSGRNDNSTVVRVNPVTGAENLVSSGGLLSNVLGIAYGPD